MGIDRIANRACYQLESTLLMSTNKKMLVLLAVVVSALMVGCEQRSTGAPDSQAETRDTRPGAASISTNSISPNGRFQIVPCMVHGSYIFGDGGGQQPDYPQPFKVDTQTGKVWIFTSSAEMMGGFRFWKLSQRVI